MDILEKWKVTIITCFSVAGIMYMFLTPPSWVVVDKNGDVEGHLNKARATLQGKQFWRNQVYVVRAEIDRSLSKSVEISQLMNEAHIKYEQVLEKIYQEDPSLRPSEVERKAKILMQQASQMKMKELDLLQENARKKRITELKLILLIVEGKAK